MGVFGGDERSVGGGVGRGEVGEEVGRGGAGGVGAVGGGGGVEGVGCVEGRGLKPRATGEEGEPGGEDRAGARGVVGEVFLPALQDFRIQFSRAGEEVELFVGSECGGVVGAEQIVARFLALVGEKGVHEFVFLGLDGGGEFGAFAEEFAVGGGGVVEFGEEGFFGGFFGGGEHAVERVVVAGGNGVEFVIVAAGAGDGEAEEAAGDDVDAVVDDVVLLAEKTAAEGVEAHRGEGGLIVAERELVGGELFDDEAVEGEIGVEGADDVVAVGVREGEAAFGVADEIALRVGVAGDVEPEAAPAFAVAGGGEEAVDGAGVGGVRGGRGRDGESGRGGDGGKLTEEGLHLFGGGWKAREVVGDTTEEGAGIGGGSGGEARGGEFGEDEGVDERWGLGFGVWDLGARVWDFGEGLEGPVLAGAGHVEGGGCDGAGAGIGSAEAYPGFEGGNFFGGEFAAGDGAVGGGLGGGHLQVFVGVADGLDQEAFVGIAGDEGGTGRAAFEQGVAGVESEAAFGFSFGLAVTFVTGLDENGADGGFEELDLFGWEGGGGRGGVAGQAGERCEEEQETEGSKFLAAKRRKKAEGDRMSKGA